MRTLLLVVGLFTLSTAVESDAAERGVASLAGLRGVFVMVPELPPAVRQGGLPETKVREVVEATLKDAGITARKEPAAEDGDANLIVIIDTIRHPQGIYLFRVEVAVVQMVHLTRAPKNSPIPATTWSANALGLTTPTKMDIIEFPLKEKLADFVQAFRSVQAK